MADGLRPATGKARAAFAALTAAFLASCTATSGPGFDTAATPSYSGVGVVSVMADVAQSKDGEYGFTQNDDDSQPADEAETSAADGIELPQQVALVPDVRPGTEKSTAAGEARAAAEASDPQAAGSAAAPADTAAAQPAPTPAGANAPAAETSQSAAESESAVSGTEAGAEGTQIAAQEEPKKRGFLAAFFSPAPTRATPSPIVPRQSAAAEQPAKPTVRNEPARKPAPIINFAEPSGQRPLVQRASLSTGDALPGVRQTALFEISRRSGLDDDSDVDLHEDVGAPVVLASAAGMARLAPNGLLRQRENVDVACLKPALVRVLKTVERRFARKLIVTSGYRSPTHNRRVRGARNSMHMYCAAADIQVPGVSKWEVASFVRTMPGRGGVGTYCHTESVHVDVGPERDWNWRCRRRKN